MVLLILLYLVGLTFCSVEEILFSVTLMPKDANALLCLPVVYKLNVDSLVQYIKGALSWRFCCCLYKTAQILDKEPCL